MFCDQWEYVAADILVDRPVHPGAARRELRMESTVWGPAKSELAECSVVLTNCLPSSLAFRSPNGRSCNPLQALSPRPGRHKSTNMHNSVSPPYQGRTHLFLMGLGRKLKNEMRRCDRADVGPWETSLDTHPPVLTYFPKNLRSQHPVCMMKGVDV